MNSVGTGIPHDAIAAPAEMGAELYLVDDDNTVALMPVAAARRL